MNIETLFPLNFSHTIMSDVHRCEVFFFNSHCRKFELERNSDLIAGANFAKGCEIARRGFYNEGLDIEEAVENGYNYILSAEDTGDFLKSNDRLAFLLKKYFQRFPMDKSWAPLALVDGTYAIEYAFEFDLGIPHPDIPDRNIHFSGKLDLLAERRLAGGVKVNAIVDEKTTKSVKRVEGSGGTVDIAKEELSYLSDGQLIAYAWAAQQLKLPCEMGYIRRIPILTNYEPAFELEIPINPFMIENWSKSTFNKITELAEKYKYYKAKGDLFSAFTPDYNHGCNAFARSCKYKIGCTREEGDEMMIQQFKQSVWDSATSQTYSLSEYKKLKGIH